MTEIKSELHPRNRHTGLYDFKQLINHCPDLAQFVTINQYGNESINFADPLAVKNLNKALLKLFYNITWDLPDHFLCPAIPSRADYIHYIADLLNTFNGGIIPQGKKTIFINNDLDFDISICNLPFHPSLRDAQAGTQRKWKNLKIKTNVLNFGGQNNELWCPGGEVSFIKRMIKESAQAKSKWFTTLVSKSSNLPTIYQTLNDENATEVRTIDMGPGQKRSRIVAWTFQ